MPSGDSVPDKVASMRVGILTGGGDCPGLNAVIRAVVRKIHNSGGECVGILEGWRGLVQNLTCPLDVQETDGIIAQGGTILGSSRTNPYKKTEQVQQVLENFRKNHLDALVAIGGEDTLGVAHKLHEQEGLPVVGVPKTIDNDLGATDFTFGFDTAINIVVDAVDGLRTTAESHRRIFVVETMGRHAGWIACLSGMAVAADYILVPENPINLEHLCQVLSERRAAGKKYGIVIASEGAQFPDRGAISRANEQDDFGHVRLGGIGEVLAGLIEKRLNEKGLKIETRHVNLGHLQRGGPPSAFDRVLATRLGLKAAELVLAGRFGTMSALRGNEIVAVSLAEAVNNLKKLDLRYLEEAQEWFLGAYQRAQPAADG
jgi:6-phosphofructokinase 1